MEGSGNELRKRKKSQEEDGPQPTRPRISISIRTDFTDANPSLQNRQSIMVDAQSLKTWGLPNSVVTAYAKKGVSTMFEWQHECLKLEGVLQGSNLVYSAPTSAGKTLVAELLVLKTVLERRKKAIFVLPFKAMVREKTAYMQDLLQDEGLKVGAFMGSHTPPGGLASVDVAICVNEKGNSLLNRMMTERSLDQLGIVVVDELHQIGDRSRGYIIELLLTKLKFLQATEFCPDKIQLIGMSATLPNLELLARWLGAQCYSTSFRPVPLTQYALCQGAVCDVQMIRLGKIKPNIKIEHDDSCVSFLCLKTVLEGCSAVVFCMSKAHVESLASKIASDFKKLLKGNETHCQKLREQIRRESIEELHEQLLRCPVGAHKFMIKAIASGVGIHHAGLSEEERDIVELGFRRGALRVMVATSTLCSGVNLPARLVIVRYGPYLTKQMYQQMVGRAGRMGIDTRGESYLVLNSSQEESVAKVVMNPQLPSVKSCMWHPDQHIVANALKQAILEIIASEVATSRADVLRYMSCTLLYADMQNDFALNVIIETCLEYLQDKEFIKLSDTRLIPYRLGKACLAAAMKPDEGLELYVELERAQSNFVLKTELHLLYMAVPEDGVAATSDIDWFRWLNKFSSLSNCSKHVASIVGVEESFIFALAGNQVNRVAQNTMIRVARHIRFRKALALLELVNETHLDTVANELDWPRGKLQALQHSAAAQAGRVTAFCRALGWHSMEILMSGFQERLQFGVQAELCELLQVSLLNGRRARGLFTAGFTSLASLAQASVDDVELIIVNLMPFEASRPQENETPYGAKTRYKEKALFVTGREGLTERMAAERIILEAQKILQDSLGVATIDWSRVKRPRLEVPTTSNQVLIRDELEDTEVLQDAQVAQNPPAPQDAQVALDSPAPQVAQDPLNVPPNAQAALDSPAPQDVAFLEETDSLIEKEVQPIGKSKASYLNGSHHNGSVSATSMKVVKELNSSKTQPPVVYDCFSEPEESENPLLHNHLLKATTEFQATTSSSQLKIKVEGNNNTDSEFERSNRDSYRTPKSSSTDKVCHPVRKHMNKRQTKQSPDIFNWFPAEHNNPNLEVEIANNVQPQENMSPTVIENSPERFNTTSNLSHSSLHCGPELLEVLQKFDKSFKPSQHRHTITADEEACGPSSKPEETIPQSQVQDDSMYDVAFLSVFEESSSSIEQRLYTKNLSQKKIISEKSNVSHQCEQNTTHISHANASKYKSNNERMQTESKKIDILKSLKSKPMAKSNNRAYTSDLTRGKDIEINAITTSLKSRPVTDNINSATANTGNIKSTETNMKAKPSPMSVTKITTATNSELNGRKEINVNTLTRLKSRLDNPTIINEERRMNVITSTQNTETARDGNLSTRNTQINPVINLNSEENSNHSAINDVNMADRENFFIVKVESREVFDSFAHEWKRQNSFSLSVSCESNKQSTCIGELVVGSAAARIPGAASAPPQKYDADWEYRHMKLAGVAVCWGGLTSYYLDLHHNIASNVSIGEKLDLLQSVLTSDEVHVLINNSKQQLRMLRQWTEISLHESGLAGDPLIASWLIDPDDQETLPGLATACCPQVLSKCCKYADLMARNLGLSPFSQAAPHVQASIDASLTFYVCEHLHQQLQQLDLWQPYVEMELPLVPCLVDSEVKGFCMERSAALRLVQHLKNLKLKVEKEAWRLAGTQFNLSAWKEIAQVLYNILALNAQHGNFKAWRTDKEALTRLSRQHRVPKLILDFRSLEFIITQVLEPLTRKIQTCNEDLCPFLPCYTTNTKTGRIYMQNPNLQNIPRDLEILGELVSPRSVFKARPGCILVSADYCQLELRILAGFSKDSALTSALCSSQDVFKVIAGRLNNVAVEAVTEQQRQNAKKVCYGIMYGIGADSLAVELGVSDLRKARELMRSFYAHFPTAFKYMMSIKQKCLREVEVKTLMSRRRMLFEVRSTNEYERAKGERQAVNTVLQGSAADLTKCAISMMQKALKHYRLDYNTTLVLQLHDELIYETTECNINKVAWILRKSMENAIVLDFPVPVKLRCGKSWGSLSPINVGTETP